VSNHDRGPSETGKNPPTSRRISSHQKNDACTDSNIDDGCLFNARPTVVVGTYIDSGLELFQFRAEVLAVGGTFDAVLFVFFPTGGIADHVIFV